MTEEERIRRSIEFGEAICRKIKKNPKLITDVALNNIKKWEAMGNMTPALQEWKKLLGGSRQRIYEILTGTDSDSQRIRSSNPFTGVLTQEERNEINKKYLKTVSNL